MLVSTINLDLLGIHDLEVDTTVVGSAGMTECLVDALVGVLKLHVLADHRDCGAMRWVNNRVDNSLPPFHVGGRSLKTE